MENNVNNVKQESVTRSLRITSDRATEYDKIKDLFSNGNEFADWILSAYRLHESKQTSDLFTQDANAIMDMFQSISNRISNIIEMANDTVKNKDVAIADELRARDEKLDNLRAKVKELEEIVSEKDTEIKAQKDITKGFELQLKEQAEVLKKAQKDYELTSKLNDELLEKKEHYKTVEVQNKALVEELSTLKENLTEVENRANSEAQKVIELQRDKELLQEKHSDKIEKMETTHKQEIEHLVAMKELEISGAKAEVNEQAQVKLDALRDKIDSLKDTIDTIKAEKENSIKELKTNHDNQVVELNKEIESLKAALQNSKKSKEKGTEQ